MKIRKILSTFLALLMTMTGMSMVAFANDNAELTANVAPLIASINTAGADAQRCTTANATDNLGRTVQQIIPNASIKPTSNVMPAWISSKTDRINMPAAGTYSETMAEAGRVQERLYHR